MIRQSISATSSEPTCQRIFWLMKYPSPSAVCFGPTMPTISALITTCSPGFR